MGSPVRVTAGYLLVVRHVLTVSHGDQAAGRQHHEPAGRAGALTTGLDSGRPCRQASGPCWERAGSLVTVKRPHVSSHGCHRQLAARPGPVSPLPLTGPVSAPHPACRAEGGCAVVWLGCAQSPGRGPLKSLMPGLPFRLAQQTGHRSWPEAVKAPARDGSKAPGDACGQRRAFGGSLTAVSCAL